MLRLEFRSFFNRHVPALAVLTAVFLAIVSSGSAFAAPCEVNDPSGTVTLPPAGCEYLGDGGVFEIYSGLPVGTTIELAPVHKDFICDGQAAGHPSCDIPAIPGVTCEEPGGDFPSGNAHCFDSNLEFEVTGTGSLSGFSRTITVQAVTVVDTATRTPGDPVQSFETSLVALEGELFGDPDFCTFRIRAGDDFGLPSPGHTTLTNIGGNDWSVDSFFDITYEIEFLGCPGSVLEGFGGTSLGQVRTLTGESLETVPSVTGPGLALLATLLAGSTFYVLRRRYTA